MNTIKNLDGYITAFASGFALGSEHLFVKIPVATAILIYHKEYIFDTVLTYYSKAELYYESFYETGSESEEEEKSGCSSGCRVSGCGCGSGSGSGCGCGVEIKSLTIQDDTTEVFYRYNDKYYSVIFKGEIDNRKEIKERIESVIGEGNRDKFVVNSATIGEEDVKDILERYLGPNQDFYGNGNGTVVVQMNTRYILESIDETSGVLKINISKNDKIYHFKFEKDQDIIFDFNEKTETTSDGYIQLNK